jgi:hypothetical protein
MKQDKNKTGDATRVLFLVGRGFSRVARLARAYSAFQGALDTAGNMAEIWHPFF